MRATTVLLLSCLAVSTSAFAHHSAAMFDAAKTLNLSGTVAEWRFVNPHSWLYLVVTDASGKDVVWKLEGGSPSHMARNGWTFKTLKKGDKVTASFHPRLDGDSSGSFQAVQLADGTVMTTMGSIGGVPR